VVCAPQEIVFALSGHFFHGLFGHGDSTEVIFKMINTLPSYLFMS